VNVEKPRVPVGQQRDRFHGGRLGDLERAQLAAGFGSELRSARIGAGLSCRQLAARAGCASSSVSRLENGLRRPRPALVGALGGVLDPCGAGLVDRLNAAAGGSLRPDTSTGLRARRRRTRRAKRNARVVAQPVAPPRVEDVVRRLLEAQRRVVGEAKEPKPKHRTQGTEKRGR
jgi:transcriptional regulator with XRE-family HTH domain